ncbi:hypothetical protein FQN54_004019 [Arachnomyces sp. PD_36]|nr:hypothetical protein FQN54_004019 [Arachnomyces sp. PD_36]
MSSSMAQDAERPNGICPTILDPDRNDQVSAAEEGPDAPSIPSILLDPSVPDKHWHGKDPVLRMFDYLELQDYGRAFGPFWMSESTLEGEIHYLFRDLVEIPGLQPALRLASKFLSEAKLLPFWHALIFNQCSLLPQESDITGWPCHEIYLNPTPLSQVDLEKTKSAILCIAKNVTILSHKREYFEHTWAFTKRTTRHIPSDSDGKDTNNNGTSSYITISPGTFKLLHPSTNLPTDQRLRVSLMLAVNLCHEFAHAVYMSREPLPLLQNGKPQNPHEGKEIEPFINHGRTPELGHAWESILFGGRLSSLGCREDCLYGLGFVKWPDSKTEYCQNPITGTIAPIARANTSALKWDTLYVVPMDFVESLFDQKYWNQTVRENGTGALRFPKTLGCRKRNYDWVDEGFGDGYDTDDSERSRHADSEGIVRPDQPELPPSPVLSDLDEDDDNDRMEAEYTSCESTASSGYPPGYSDFENDEGEADLELRLSSDDDDSPTEASSDLSDMPPVTFDTEVSADELEPGNFEVAIFEGGGLVGMYERVVFDEEDGEEGVRFDDGYGEFEFPTIEFEDIDTATGRDEKA